MRRWVLYGCRTAYAVEVAESIWRRGEEVVALVDNLAGDGPPEAGPGAAAGAAGALVVGSGQLEPELLALDALIPLITPGHRFAVAQEAQSLGFCSFPALVDPTAVVARTAGIGEGSAVNAGAVVGGGTEVGRFVHVNRSASIGHHGVIADFATVGPGCVLAGQVTISSGAFVGAGAVCAPGVNVGANAVVGTGAVVVGDVAAGDVVVGNPAKPLPGRSGGYRGASVPA